MSRPNQRKGGNQNRRPQQQQKRPSAVDIWRDPGPLPDIQPIEVAPDPGALLRSLGDPPLIDGDGAVKAFVSVIGRAAAIASALALSADVLAEAADD